MTESPPIRALITRPRIDAGALAERLAARGVQSLIAPLIEIRQQAGADLDLGGVQAVLFTSANGVRAFAARSPDRDIAAFAVGDATAQTAHASGFRRIESAAGDVAALAELVAARLDPDDGALLHAAAGSVAGDLAARLEKSGFVVRRAVLYEARPIDAMPAAARDALLRGEIDCALFFSPRTARTFVSLARAGDCADSCSGVTALCLSPAVAAALAEIRWRAVCVAARPDQTAMDILIEEFAERRP